MDAVIQNDQPAPDFQLAGLDGKFYHLEDYLGTVVILDFWSADCPWVERVDDELSGLLPDWGADVTLWRIASNANESRQLIESVAAQRGLPVVLLDPNSEVAELYNAQTTPHFYVVDQDGFLRYQGALDNVTFRQKTPTQSYLKDAVDKVLAGRQPEPDHTPPYGCAIVKPH